MLLNPLPFRIPSRTTTCFRTDEQKQHGARLNSMQRYKKKGSEGEEDVWSLTDTDSHTNKPRPP